MCGACIGQCTQTAALSAEKRQTSPGTSERFEHDG
jgi:hypothetical protein